MGEIKTLNKSDNTQPNYIYLVQNRCVHIGKKWENKVIDSNIPLANQCDIKRSEGRWNVMIIVYKVYIHTYIFF